MRVKGGVRTRQRHNKILDLAKGFRMTRRKQIKVATQAVLHAGEYAFMGRKLRKRNFRQLWIVRINAQLRNLQTNYSTFTKNLKTHNVLLDRKNSSSFCSRKT
ncbi:MAG: 50S ribosomal protein L20 [Microgenomates bacterium OLB23]|nr:MAG: 50S ribosomal protein L20 [Microgenomates bacterium OLB23]